MAAAIGEGIKSNQVGFIFPVNCPVTTVLQIWHDYVIKFWIKSFICYFFECWCLNSFIRSLNTEIKLSRDCYLLSNLITWLELFYKPDSNILESNRKSPMPLDTDSDNLVEPWKCLKELHLGRNPFLAEGCLKIGEGLVANLESPLELLDLFDIVTGNCLILYWTQ